MIDSPDFVFYCRKSDSNKKEAIRKLREIHENECKLYRLNRAAHPDHDRTRRLWENAMAMRGIQTIRELDWVRFWTTKMEELMEESWAKKKEQTLALMSKVSSSDSDDSSSKRKSKKKKSKKKKKKRSHSSSSPEEKKVEEPSSSGMPEFAEAKSNTSHVGKSNVVAATASSTNQSAEDVTSILSSLSDRFGALGASINILHKSVTDAISAGKDPLSCFNEDAKLLLNLVEGKLKKQLTDGSFNLVQKAITQEALDRLEPFLKMVLQPQTSDKFNIDTSIIAQATKGQSVQDIVNFIKHALAYRQITNYTYEDIMNIYQDVKSKHIQSELESSLRKREVQQAAFKKPPPSPDESLSMAFSSSESRAAPMRSHPVPRPGPSTSAQSFFDLAEKQIKIVSKQEQIEKRFMQLSNKEKMNMFSNFKSLPYEERNFLLNHVDSLEKTDPKLAYALRLMITRSH